MTTDPLILLQKKYDAIQAGLAVDYRGYRLDKMTEPFLSALVFRHMPKRRQWGLALKKFTSIRRLDGIPEISDGVFFSFPEWTNRKDYLEISEYVRAQVKDTCFFRLSALRRKPVFNLRHLRRAIGLCRGLPQLDLTGRVYMTAAVYSSLLLADEAERQLKLAPKKYVSFSCVMGIEHLLTQYFRKKGIPTYNLQHGVTALYRKNPQDALEYTNIIADYHLAWGEYSRHELIKYGLDAGHVLAAGYPRPQAVLPLQKPGSRRCVVFLSRQDFNTANLSLLSILRRFQQGSPEKIRFSLKLHPSLSPAVYRKWIHDNCNDGSVDLLEENRTLQELLQSGAAGFCIVVNSSAYYECYMNGLVALRYHSDDFDTGYAVSDDLFSTGEELARLLKALYESFEEHFPADRIRQVLQYVLGLPGNEYGKILNG
jgi:hypothetical protein